MSAFVMFHDFACLDGPYYHHPDIVYTVVTYPPTSFFTLIIPGLFSLVYTLRIPHAHIVSYFNSSLESTCLRR